MQRAGHTWKKTAAWSVALPVVLLVVLAASSACFSGGEQATGSADATSEPGAASAAVPAPQPGTSVLFGTVPPASGGVASVVILELETPRAAGEAGAGVLPPAVIDQFGMAFVPDVLVVHPGQAVEFRNSEDLLHNIHVVDSRTASTLANVATPTVDSTFELTFETSGVYSVSCDIHSTMGASIIVTPSPYSVVAEKDGTFELPGVRHGRYRLRVWNIDEARRSTRVVTVEGPRTEVSVVENR